jgi:hypothetical protein
VTTLKKIRKNIIDGVATYAYIMLYKLTPNLGSIYAGKIMREKKIIVSLTSIPDRIDNLWIVIESLFRQQMKADKIILWLSSEQFENAVLPKNLTSLVKKGLEIRYCDDLKPHKKYYYSMLENPDSIVVTVDDDSIYHNNLLKLLYKSYQRFPDCVSCLRAHRIILCTNGYPIEYSKWHQKIKNCKAQPNAMLMAVGKGGVLYPPRILPEEAFNKEKSKAMALYADDIWLKVMELINSVKVVKANRGFGWTVDIFGSQDYALYKVNAPDDHTKIDRNDLYMRKLWEAYIDKS